MEQNSRHTCARFCYQSKIFVYNFGMDEFTDESIQITFESDDDSRITMTMVNVEGRKITEDQYLFTLEHYLYLAAQARDERIALGASLQ